METPKENPFENPFNPSRKDSERMIPESQVLKMIAQMIQKMGPSLN